MNQRPVVKKSRLNQMIKTNPFVILLAGILISCADASKNKPNIVFILIDDLGYKDLSCYGSAFYQTPNIDRLAAKGTKFTQAYTASAKCSPTRASILTGKYPGRLKITDWIGPEEWHPNGVLATPEIVENLPYSEITLAEAFKDQGYNTCYIGKWHLGSPEYYPPYHGFDFSIAANDAGAPPSYFYPYRRDNWAGTGWPTQIKDLVENGTEGEYLADRLTEEAIHYLDTIGDQPFLLYLAHYAVHKPFQAKDEIIQKYQMLSDSLYPESLQEIIPEKNNSFTRIVQNHATYGAMVESTDQSVGKILEKLQEENLLENTIIIFTSDNGGLSTSNFPLSGGQLDKDGLATSNLPLRAGKGWYYEGGIRVPTIVYWPGVTEANSVIEHPITSTDYFPTLLEMAGLDLLPEQHVDGKSFAPLLKGEEFNRGPLFWHFPHYHNSGQKPVSAILDNHYKLIQWYESDNVELYNLTEDIGESKNLADGNQEIVEEMLQKLEAWKVAAQVDLPEKKQEQKEKIK